MFYLAPDEALRGVTEHWAERWSAATGVEIVVGETGAELWLVGDIPLEDGRQAPGWTNGERTLALIHYRGRDVSLAVGHEIGHLLGGDHTEEQGLLYGGALPEPVINTAALETVCARLHCATLRPE